MFVIFNKFSVARSHSLGSGEKDGGVFSLWAQIPFPRCYLVPRQLRRVSGRSALGPISFFCFFSCQSCRRSSSSPLSGATLAFCSDFLETKVWFTQKVMMCDRCVCVCACFIIARDILTDGTHTRTHTLQSSRRCSAPESLQPLVNLMKCQLTLGCVSPQTGRDGRILCLCFHLI